jgi:hypothetical protein
MNDTAKTEEITIQGHTFVAPVRYAEGHTLTANEAGALNQTYHENLRNNFASSVRKALEEHYGTKGEDGKVSIPDDAELNDEQLAAVQAEFDAYAQAYEFGARRAGGARQSTDPVEREAINLAKTAIREALRKQGKKAEADAVAAAAKQLVDTQPHWKETAARRVAEQQAIAEGGLSDVLGALAA